EQCFKYDSGRKRDPFVPLVSKDGIYVSDAYGIKSIKDIRLEGIVWEVEKPSIAIINGEIVGEGAEIGVIKVLKIERDSVVFDVDGQAVRVELITE
ncbi:MAG: general secretion pathway protein GspB, partial [Candidatus Omnitrophica bacterium]|nr:general secretion pathway protein GspB [Candidatus Omnitrophota bacterium]